MVSRDPLRVVSLIYDGLGTFEFGIVVELFGLRRTGLSVPWYQFEVCSVERGPVKATGGISIQAKRGLRAFDRAGTIVIPGWPIDETPPPKLIRALCRAHADGARLVSICSGVFLLAATGLLDGKRVTGHWRHADRLIARYPNLRIERDVLYVDEGNILTSAGSAAGIDLGLHIIRLDHGAEIANEIARRLVMQPHRDGGQAQYVRDSGVSPIEGGLAPVLEWAQGHLARSLTVDDFARRARMSPRTFARRFREQTGTTPHQWLTHQRLLAAQRRLETTQESIDRIADAVGMRTAATLRQRFSQAIGTSPSAYRRRFRLRPPN
jgi:AraC family transcriptional regulator, transcriptional activator FtrA